MKRDYNIELRKRFVKDYKLPFNIVEGDDLFNYYLGLFETNFKTLSLWQKTLKEININFNGNVEMFITNYYNVREKIIQTILHNPAYESFNNMDMSKYTIKDKINISTNNVYNCNNVRKIFISIDIKKANFQAIKYVEPAIVYNAASYDDFIRYFTNSNYIVNSKYFRNVVFGKCNPKRHITVEKYIINEIRKHIGEKLFRNIDINLISFSNDEIVYECSVSIELFNEEMITYIKSVINDLKNEIKDFIGVDVSITMFNLKGYNLCNTINNKVCKIFFVKEDCLSDKKEFKCVPEPLFAIIYKLYNKQDVLSADRIVNYDGLRAELTEDFYIKEI